MSRKELFRRMRKSKFFLIGLFVILSLFAVCYISPLIVVHDPIKVDLTQRLKAPDWFSQGWAGNILGMDALGRDVLTRLLLGGRTSLTIAAVGVILPCVVGTFLGIAAGYYGGRVDMIIMRLSDIQLSFPQMILAIAVMAVLGASVRNLIIVVAITSWVNYARIARSTALRLRKSEFISAAKVLGASDLRIMLLEIFPNVLTPLIILLSQQMGSVILTEASLSFLGCGVPPPSPTWGMMISEGRDYMVSSPWTVLVPGIALMITVLGFNFLGDGIRDVLDEKNKD